MNLKCKKILVGVTGGVAAYKSVDLVRRLKETGSEVRVVMTKAAKEFITPLTLQAVSGHEAKSGMDHIELARWADFILVAPASADFLARLAYGHANDLLTTLCLATSAPIAVAPAMNQQMWLNPITQTNIQRLQHHRVLFFGPGEGEQACGEVGLGRMLEPSVLVDFVARQFQSKTLQNKKIVLTGGPTHEAIDPVRYLSNCSSGKMGFALAQAANDMGAEVVLISGPCHLSSSPQIKRIHVTSTEQMYSAVMEQMVGCDVFISAAAVVDYAVEEISLQKIKKSSETMTLKLKRNRDIVSTVAALENRPITIGFAAETEKVIEHAKAKLKEKHLDMIVANQVGFEQGFDSDDTAVTVIHKDGTMKEIPLASKHSIASELMEMVADLVTTVVA